MLKNVINAIADIELGEVIETESLKVINPNNKIQFNSLKNNVSTINEYKVYRGKINAIYDELENHLPC